MLSPLPPTVNNSFLIKSDKIYLGQIELIQEKKKNLLNLIENAIQGVIETSGGKIVLPRDGNLRHYSKASQRDQWFYELHLSTYGAQRRDVPPTELTEIDNLLRLSTPPFDGLNDVANWLGLKTVWNDSRAPMIDIRIAPPVDLMIDESSLNDDKFKLTLHAHPHFDTNLIRLALRGVPGEYLKTRLQVASKIKWQKIRNGRRTGTGTVTVKNSDNILAMLMIGNSIVRRQWFSDPKKARNNRLLAVQSFDKDLKMIKQSVLESMDSVRFEKGIAALLFLLGFSPCVQLENDSPDLIVQTPNGRIILVECTLRISDFPSKLGKLVDRRGSLIKELEKSGHSISIATVLVCRLPRDQIAIPTEDLISHKTILVTEEQLNDAFNQVRNHNDPDKILEDGELTLRNNLQLPLALRGE